MSQRITNKICVGKKSKNTLVINNIQVSIKFIVKCDRVYMTLHFKDHAYIKLSARICCNKFKSAKILRLGNTSFNLIDDSKCDLKLTLAVDINKITYTIVITTDKLNKYMVNITSTNTVTLKTLKALKKLNNYFVSYVDSITNWWPPVAIAASIGVPSYSHPYSYNIINMAFWTTNKEPADAALLWSQALTYVSSDNPWGQTTSEIQQAWINLYHTNNVRVLVSAFGATDFPTSQGTDPIVVAE